MLFLRSDPTLELVGSATNIHEIKETLTNLQTPTVFFLAIKETHLQYPSRGVKGAATPRSLFQTIYVIPCAVGCLIPCMVCFLVSSVRRSNQKFHIHIDLFGCWGAWLQALAPNDPNGFPKVL